MFFIVYWLVGYYKFRGNLGSIKSNFVIVVCGCLIIIFYGVAINQYANSHVGGALEVVGSLFEGNVGFLFGESPLLSYDDFSRFSVFMKVKGALSLIYTASGFALA